MYLTCRPYILLRQRNVSDRVAEKIKTYTVGQIMFFSPSAHPGVYEIMWTNMVQANKPQMPIKQDARALRAGKFRLQT